MIYEFERDIRAYVQSVHGIAHGIIEVVVEAPLAARNFRPGQFFKLQNFAHNNTGRKLLMEPLALTGAWVDADKGLVSLIALEMGGSSDLCAHLQPCEPVVLMGPTGMPTEIPSDETVMLVGGGLGNAVLFSIGKALKNNNNRVIYFAGYRRNRDRFKTQDIEAASDKVIWCCDEKPEFMAGRAGDSVFHGNIIEAIENWRSNPLNDIKISRVITIGSDGLMAAVQQYMTAHMPGVLAIGSINSPMQCMMKEICAQCLQRHVDSKTGQESYVYSCRNQDQELLQVDFGHLKSRLQQNSLQEKITKLWFAHAD